MSIPFFLIGLLVFIFFWLRKPLENSIIIITILSFLLSTFFIVLSPGSGILGQLSSGFHSVAVGAMLSVAVRGVGALKGHSNIFIRRATISVLIIFTIVTFHNVLEIGRLVSSDKDSAIAVANPWGIDTLLLVIVFTLHSRVWLDDPNQRKNLKNIILVFSSLFILIDLLVVAGVLTGNTQKLGEGIGGRGLANISTNETGILGVSLLLWNLVFLFQERKFQPLHALLGAGNFMMVVFAKSRVALGLSLLVLTLYLLFSTIKTKIKFAIFFPALVFMLLISSTVIQERTQSEGIGDPNNPLTELPGSGRPIIWFYYMDAFMYTAESNPLQWLLGVGVMGLVDLYDLTPLVKFSLVLEKVYFYPLHSDAVKVFLIAGIIGFAAWVLIPYYLYKIPTLKKYRFQFTSAIAVLYIFTTVDMLNYFPVATLLLMLAIGSAIDRNEGKNDEAAA